MTVPPRRLLDSSPERSKEETRLAAYLRAVPEPLPLSPEAVERVSRNLAVAPVPSLWARLLKWALAITTPLLLVGAWALHGAPEAPPPRPVRAVPRSSARPVPAPTPAPSEPIAQQALPTPEPAPVKAPPPTAPPPRRHRAPKPVAAPPLAPLPSPSPSPAAPTAVAPPAPTLDPLIEESRLLQSALHQLRIVKDGRAALAVLDTYEQRFPRGQLRAEATLARVDALLLLGRAADALGRLQGLPAADRARLPRSRELQVLEVELLSEVGRCEEALRKLSAFRSRDSEPLLDERALFVQATCEAQTHRVEAARALYEDLLRRWPNGAHAAEARRALGRTP